MASNMEVDSPKGGGTEDAAIEEETVTTTLLKQQPFVIAVHPLAIVHMTDQHTRVTCGGSRYDVHSPVVGLLLGRLPEAPSGPSNPSTTTTTTESPVIKVLEADDIPLDMSEATQKQVELHQAVFPLHSVVGWYRVASTDDDDDDDLDDMKYQPTEDDVRMTRDLRHFFQQQQQQQQQKPQGEDSDDGLFLFALLQIPLFESTKSTMKPSQQDQQKQEQLPLNLFRLFQNSSLIGLEYNHDWKLETSEPERIAIERVIREKPTAPAAASSDNKKEDAGGQVAIDSGYVSHTQSLQHSLEAMQQRIRIIMDYLSSISPPESTAPATTVEQQQLQTPPNPALLRQIQSLLGQLGVLAASWSNHDDFHSTVDASLLAQLATVAKTVSAVHSYTEKLQAIQEHRALSNSNTSGGGIGGGASTSREDRRRRH